MEAFAIGRPVVPHTDKPLIFATTFLPRGAFGSDVATACVLDALRATGRNVTVIGQRPNWIPEGECATDEIAVKGGAVETRSAPIRRMHWGVKSFLTNSAYSVSKYSSREYARTLVAAINKLRPKTVVVDHIQMWWVKDLIPREIPVVCVAHNVESEVYASLARAAESSYARRMYEREARLLETLERRVMREAEATLAFTEHDAAYFSSLGDHRALIRVIPIVRSFNGVTRRSHGSGSGVRIIGNWNWEPNRIGLEWYLRRVHPRLPPSVSVEVAGRGWDGSTYRFENLCWRGYVPDSGDFLRSGSVVAIPNVCGGGVQIKTLDAIACGVPIVSTSSGVRGLEEFPQFVEVTDEEETFAAHLTSHTLKGGTLDNDRERLQDAEAFVLGRKRILIRAIEETFEYVTECDRGKRVPATAVMSEC